MDRPFPLRPRLAKHVIARRYLSADADRVVLHDLSTDRRLEVGLRAWWILAAADGTRDLEGVRLAAAREGAESSTAHVRTFFDDLHRDGLIEEGVEAPAVRAASGTADADRSLPVFPLPGFSLHCDGRGSCCRFYTTVLFGPIDAARARASLPKVLDGGERHECVFTPEYGSDRMTGSAVALRDGACAYLTDDLRCGIHGAAGADAKPVGCQTYPAFFVDDGDHLRVSVCPECACVFESVGRASGAPLVPPGTTRWADLPHFVHVSQLADPVALDAGRSVPRSEFVAWSNAVLSTPDFHDPIAMLWGLADGIQSDGLSKISPLQLNFPPPDVNRLAPWIEALHQRVTACAKVDSTWRSPCDLTRRVFDWLRLATFALLDPDAAEAVLGAAALRKADEDFYLRALFHGHRVVGARPLERTLRDLCVRLLTGRMLSVLFATLPESELDPACCHPLALVEAALRGHGIDAYVDAVPL